MHPIFALWAHPRSMSTAIERIMRERGDLDCAHEPFMYDYYVHRSVRQMPHFEANPEQPASYEAIREWLLRRAEARPVFIKDMAYYVMPRLLEDDAFCARISHSFLVRDPVAAILSYHKLDPELTAEELGLKAQWELFEALRARGLTPPVLAAEAVQADPRGVVAAWWQRIGLAFEPHAFDWDHTTHPEEWTLVSGWHGEVARSGGIAAEDAARRVAREAEFAARAEKYPELAALLEGQRPYYARLRAAAL